MKLKVKNQLRKKRNDNLGRTPTFSYRAARSKIDSQERKSRLSINKAEQSGEKNQKKYRYILYLRRVFVFVFLLLFFINLRISSAPNIEIAVAEGGGRRPTKLYETGIKEIWNNNIFFKSKLTINTHTIDKQIKERFPEVKDVYIDLPMLGSKPIVKLTLNAPVAVLSSQANHFYIASNGKTLALVSDLSGDITNVPTIIDESGLIPTPGSLALPSQDVTTILKIAELCRASNIKLTNIVLPAEPNEVVLKLESSKYHVRLSLDKEAEQGVGALIALRKKFEIEKTSPQHYVDLRVPDKAFYR